MKNIAFLKRRRICFLLIFFFWFWCSYFSDDEHAEANKHGDSSGDEEEPSTNSRDDPPSDREGKSPVMKHVPAPSHYRPEKQNNIDILERVFPHQRKSVLELVLQGCDGDLIKAIEHFFSAQDTLTAQNAQRPPVASRYHPYADLQKSTPPGTSNMYSMSERSARSAFTPLGLPVPLPELSGISGLHTAFVPQTAALRSTLGDRFYDKSALTKAYSELCQVPFSTAGMNLGKFPMYPYGLYGNVSAWDMYSDMKLTQTSPLKLQTEEKKGDWHKKTTKQEHCFKRLGIHKWNNFYIKIQLF